MTLLTHSLCGPRHAPAPRQRITDAHAGRDPTKTFRLRAKMRSESDRRWRLLGQTIRKALVEHDLLGLRGVGGIPHGDKAAGFGAWLREELNHKVFGLDGSWLRPYVQQAAAIAQAHADGFGVEGHVDPYRVQTMQTLAASELRGIIAYAQQQLTRCVAHCMMANATPFRTANAVAAILKTARLRASAMSDYVVAKTHAASTLSAFRNAGVTHVGIIPERVRMRKHLRTRDAEPPAVDFNELWLETKALVEAATINRSYDVIELSNRSRDGTVVYIDQHVPNILPKTGIRPDDTLPWHELSEWVMMGRGLKYLPAHNIATQIERRRVEELRPGAWNDYQREMGGLIADAKERGWGREPPDQDRRVFDAEIKGGRQGPVSRRGESASTIGRAQAAQHRLEEEFGEEEVAVVTAGDDYVCQECQDIADDGPYTLDEAESLIPAHPRCRCGFAPAGKYAADSQSLGFLVSQASHVEDGEAAGVIFHTPTGHMLLMKRSDTGEWSIPAGMLEENEEPLHAAQREAAEETGNSGNHQARKVDERTTRGIRFHTYAQPSEWQFSPILNPEHTQFGWFHRSALPEPLHPGLVATLHAMSEGGPLPYPASK